MALNKDEDDDLKEAKKGSKIQFTKLFFLEKEKIIPTGLIDVILF
jgi:hypothetical protein